MLSLALTLSASAQNFEGTITWSVRYTSTDTGLDRTMKKNGLKGFTWTVRDGNYRMTSNGGILTSDLLWLADKQQYYSLDAKTKTYKIPPVGYWAKMTEKPVITATREQRVILGYHCTKYIVTPKEKRVNLRMVFWMTTEIEGLDMKTMPTPGVGGNISQTFFHQEISGLPIMIEVATPTMTMSIDATSVTRESVSPDAFMIPADFKETK